MTGLPQSISGYRRAAMATMSPAQQAYYLGGAGEEITLSEAARAWSWWAPRPRVLRDVTRVDTSVSLLGTTWHSPIAVAPTAAQRGLHPDGELGLAAAAHALGLPYVLSTSASIPPSALAGTPGVHWFQLYVRGGVAGGLQQIAAAVASGVTVVAVTVDLPVYGPRDREADNPGEVNPTSQTVVSGGEQLAALTWDDLALLIAGSPVPIVVKGILDARDAELAVQIGAAGIWVSTHGGRQLDTVLPTAVVLPEIAAAVGGRVPILVDGGIQRGVSVAVALALGATAVCVGRLPLWGLTVGGREGAESVLRLLRGEFATTLALMGLTRATDLASDHVTAAPWRR